MFDFSDGIEIIAVYARRTLQGAFFVVLSHFPLLLKTDSCCIQYVLTIVPPPTLPTFSPPPLLSGSIPFLSLIRNEQASKRQPNMTRQDVKR